MVRHDRNPCARRATPRIVAGLLALLSLPAGALAAGNLSDAESALRLGDLRRAAALLTELAEQGDAASQYRLAALMRAGRVPAASHERAFTWMRKSADAGHRRAVIDLAAMYRDGYGTTRDLEKARALLQRAVAMGDADAARALAELQRTSAVVPARPAPQWTARVKPSNAKQKIADMPDGKVASEILQAAQRGLDDAMGKQLEGGASLASRDADGRTALMLAAAGGHDKIVARLLAAGADVNAISTAQETALLLAARGGHTPVVSRLLAAGADAGLIDVRGDSAAAEATRACRIDMLRALLAKASLPPAAADGSTLLHLAAAKCSASLAAVLIASGSDIGAPDKSNRTALWHAAERGNVAVVDLLVAKGASARAADVQGDTPLHRAASGGHAKVARRLIEAGAKLDLRNGAGNTALMLAAHAGAEEVVAELVRARADLDSRNELGMTALMLAASGGRESVVQQLLAGGADQGLRNIRRERAVDLARSSGHAQLADRLAAR